MMGVTGRHLKAEEPNPCPPIPKPWNQRGYTREGHPCSMQNLGVELRPALATGLLGQGLPAPYTWHGQHHGAS